MEQPEIDLLTSYLSRLFNEKDLVVLLHPEKDGHALVAVSENYFGQIERDAEDGEVCYNFCKDIPDQPHDELNDYFKRMFNSSDVELRRDMGKSDSAEVYRGDEFLGMVYEDEGNGEGMQAFNMAILDIDLHD